MSRRRVVQRGDKIKSGDLVGYVGCPQDNGWWFEHLHVQCLRKEIFEGKAFDGYSKYYDGITSDFPDPELVLGQEIEQSE